MPRKRKPPPKASGRNVAEHERHTERVVLRMQPVAASRLRELAAARGETVSGCVASLVTSATDSVSQE